MMMRSHTCVADIMAESLNRWMSTKLFVSVSDYDLDVHSNTRIISCSPADGFAADLALAHCGHLEYSRDTGNCMWRIIDRSYMGTSCAQL